MGDPSTRPFRTFFRYGAALLAAGLSAALSQLLWPLLQGSPAVFYAAVMISAWYGGLGPGLLAAAAGALVLEYFFTPPFHVIAIDPSDVARIVVFLLVAALISWLNARRQAAGDRLRRARDELERRVEERTLELSTAKAGLEAENAERRRSEEALQSSEERYRLLFEANPQPVWVCDAETERFLAVNESAIRHYGFSRDEFLAMHLTDIRPPELNRLALASGGRFRRRDGGLVDVEVSTASLVFQGRPARHIVASDVTERNLLEQQLRHARKMEAIGRLAGGLAHDFNNLLSVIMGRADYLQERYGQRPELRDELELILTTSDRAKALIQQLLAYGRRQVLQRQVMDVNQVIAGLMAMLQRLIGEHIELVFRPGSGLPRVLADPGQLEQVIVNLVINARDAMAQGGQLTIETVTTKRDASPGQLLGVGPGEYVLLGVADTGTGMDEDTRSQVFEPFFTTKEPGKGTGLGLSTVYGIVKQHGGDIIVESEPGRGSRFTIFLPAIAVDGPDAEVAAGELRPPGGSEVILVVEDESDMREHVRQSLASHGYMALVAANGEDALGVAARHSGPIHLLLTDIVMPKMGGVDLSRRMAAQRPETKVLYMSGHADYATGGPTALDLGPLLLKKPFRRRELLGAVRSALDGLPASPDRGHEG